MQIQQHLTNKKYSFRTKKKKKKVPKGTLRPNAQQSEKDSFLMADIKYVFNQDTKTFFFNIFTF